MASPDVKTLSREELEAEVLRLRASQAPGTAFGRPVRSTPIGHDELFSAIEKTRMPMILTDPNRPDDPIVFANRAFQQLSGYSADELLGRNCRFLQGPDTSPADMQRIRDALEAKQDIAVDLLNYRKNGTPFINELYISPVLDAGGRVLYHFGSQVDVTGYRKDRRTLETSERRQRAVFDSALDFAIVVTDRDGIVDDWNSGAERTMGWTAAEMRGQDAERFFTPEDRASGWIAHEMETALRDGRASDERWHLKKGGERFWASGEMMPLRDEDGAHIGFLKIMRDRTAEHLAGTALRASEERRKALLELSDQLAEHDTDTASLSDAACRILGQTLGVELVGYGIVDPEAETITVERDWTTGTAQSLAGTLRFRDFGSYIEDLKRGETVVITDARTDPRTAPFADALEERSARAFVNTPVFEHGHFLALLYVSTGQPRVWTEEELQFIREVAARTRAGTARRQAEAQLRASEERFTSIIDTIDAAFAIVQVKFDADDQPVDYRFVEANPAFERQAGVNLRGRWVTEFAPDLERFWFETYGHVANTGEQATFENYAEAFKRWFDVRAVRVGEPADRTIAILFSDVTARHDAEDRLRASEALARENIERVQLALAAGAIIGTWHWDIPGDRFTVDKAFARAFGLDPVLGREGIPLAQIVATVHPDDQDGLANAINEAIARGGRYAHQYRVRRHDGRYYWLEANGHVDHAPDGTPLSFPGVLIDVEERRAVEAERDRALTKLRDSEARLRDLNETLEQRVTERTTELLRAEEALRQSQKMDAVGQLTGGVAHDFNNLLTIIRSSVDFLRRPDLPEARRTRYMDAVSETVDRAAKLTGQLLAFARRQALKPEVLNVGDRLRAVADMLDTVTGARVKVVTELPDHPCFIMADLSQFETALVNMAVNARDAMDGEGTLTMRLACAGPMPPIRGHGGGPGPFAKIELSDTGSGIAEDDLARIFEPFFTTKEVGKGTGLGLSQVFGFAKQSGGDVDVRSVVGQGTTFALYLPEVEATADQDTTGDEESGLAPDGRGLRVLVVEDNIEVGKFATQILEDLGYRTEWAANAENALERLGADGDGFDAVFSDVVMPGMGGIALAKELRRRLPQLPVVLASGYSHVLAQDTGHGFELLHKPYSADQLSRVLRRVTKNGHHKPLEVQRNS